MVGIVVVLVLGIAISLLVGRVLRRMGRPFLHDVFPEDRARTAANLLAVMFYLLALGTVAVVGVAPMPPMAPVYDTVARLGVMLLILALAHGCVVASLVYLRKHHHRQVLEHGIAASVHAERSRTSEISHRRVPLFADAQDPSPQ